MQLRVAYDMTLLQSNRGGSGAYARGLLEALRAREDVEMRVIASPKRGATGTARWILRDARINLRIERPELLHSPGFLAPISPRVPHVITIHDLSLAQMPGGQALEWRLYYELVFPRLVPGVTAVITPTEATKRDVMQTFHIQADRIAVTPYGIDSRFFSGVKARGAGDETPPRILFFGPPIKRKNLDAVLNVLASAGHSSRLGRATLMITGGVAEQFPGYRDRIRTIGLSDRVIWLGMVPSADLPSLYASADLLAYPSFYEGFGFPPLESMAAGTPVVASNASCLPEVLGDAALLVDPHDESALQKAMSAALEDADLRRSLSDKGRARARLFTWERCAELTVAVYRGALN
jgi:glycosyltransferase involved in cell wall biosynthesis